MTFASDLWATRFPPPRIRGNPSQARTLARIVQTLDLTDCERAVLLVLCERADGAGFSWPRIVRLVQDTGYKERAVQYAVAKLVAAGRVERYRTLRDPTRPTRHRNPQARRGQGPTLYRLGRSLRVPAGLREVETREHLGLVVAGSENRSTAPPESGRDASAHAGLRPASETQNVQSDPEEGHCTPRLHPQIRDEAPALQGVQAESHCTPRTTELEEPSVTVGVGPPKSEADDGRAREIATTDRLIAVLANREPKPSPFVSPLDRARPASPLMITTSNEPTLDEALRNPDLFSRFVAPYGELVENEHGSAEQEVESVS